MNTDKIITAVVPVIAGYKSKAEKTLEDAGKVLDEINGDTLLVEAVKIANEINGEDI